ncbi:cholesterol 24-hydroxylase-like [Asterias rubens]|uniref:cholesterol 24-hydroxylase-like n=1 Tax=Asterias rubens TaxID=7604 RepID=UPI001455C96A|nr:cholesterol 24-hydroxylase-like [Asterias rubens]
MENAELMPTYGVYMVYVLGGFLASVVGVVLLLITFWTLYTHRVHQKYRHIPGPKLGHFYSGHIKTFQDQLKSGEKIVGDLFRQWCMEHGPICILFFFTRPVLLACSPEAVKELIVASKHPKDPMVYNDVAKLYGTDFMGYGLATEMDHSIWAIRRGIVDPGFHRRYLKQSMTQFNDSADLMIKRLHPKADGLTKVTMLNELMKVTLDVIAKVAFSCELEIMGEGVSPFTEAVQATFSALQMRSTQPFIKWNPFKAAREHRKKVRQACCLIRGLAVKTIKERLAAIEKEEDVPTDILSYIINATEGLTHQHYKMQNMVDDFVTFFIGGQETTANLLACALLQLGLHQEILYRLKNEVESVMGDKTTVDFEDLPKLQYMAAFLKESLRLFPPADGSMRLTSEECYINGYRIPAQTSCLVSFYVLSRMEKHFKDPLQFDPDRFTNNQDEHTLFSYLPFSLGPRICIGKNFAMIEAKVLLCKFLSNYELTLDPDQSLLMENQGTLRPKDGCRVTLKPTKA